MNNIKKIMSIIGIVFVLCALTAGMVSCVSPSAFKIHITSPENNIEVNDSVITVTGNVAGYTRGEVVYEEQTMRLAPEVTVNGVNAEVDKNGNFSAQVTLQEGNNTIKAVAMFNNLTVKDMIKVTYTPNTPVLTVNITAPEDGAEVNESPVTVTGTVSDAEATVKVNDAEVEVDEEGNFSTQIELNEGENIIKAEAASGELTAEDAITVNYALPIPPLSIAITSPEDGFVSETDNIDVMGTVSDIAAIVTVNDVTANINEDGTFSAQVTLTEGNNTIEAVATLGEQEATTSIQVNYVPATPVLSVEITSPEDGANLNENPVIVTGLVSDAGAVVKLNGTDVEVGVDGNFSTQVVLGEGTNTIKVEAVLGEQSAEDSVIVNYTLPAPALSVEITSPVDGFVSNSNSITVTGTVSDASASVKVNDVVAVVAVDGTYSALVTLVEGENTITALATVGESQATDSIKITYTLPVPVLLVDITSPVDGENVSANPATITGTVSNSAATVTINGNQVTVAEDGTFTTQINLVEGTNTITAGAVLNDQTAQDTITVTYTPIAASLSVDITSPEDGSVSTTDSITVTGTVSDVTANVTVNDVAVVVAGDGTFTAQVNLIKGENTIVAKAVSSVLEATDTIKITFAGPSLALEVITNPLNVTGKVSDPLAKVTVNGTEAGVAEDGTFSALITLTPGENVITVVATLGEEQTSYSFTVTYTPPASPAV